MKKWSWSLHDTFYRLGTVFLCFAYVQVVQSLTIDSTDLSDWSACSQSCNGGVRFRRTCWPTMLENATKSVESLSDWKPSCLEMAVEYEACASQMCTVKQNDHRIEQCASHNGRRVMGHVINKWTPNNKMRHSCQLSCYSKRHRLTYSFGKVLDGAKCHRSAPKVCLNGRCLPLGCDRKLGSTVSIDVCGVCGGNGDTCRLVKRVYSPSVSEHKKESYSTVATIPTKSTNVLVHSDGINHLVLLDSKRSVIINGSVNGDGIYKAVRADTAVRYFKGRGRRGEWFNAAGPIADSFHIMVQSGNHKPKPRVLYEYRVPQTRNSVLETAIRLVTSRPKPPNKTSANNAPPKNLEKKRKKGKRNKSSDWKCRRSRIVQKHFCSSEFVLRVLVLHQERHKDEIRYELQVSESFRNVVPIHPREFLWAPEACPCPKLVRGREYIIIGNTAKDLAKREVKLVINKNSYVRRYGHWRALKMKRLSKLCVEHRSKNAIK